ncbi:MAG TPA: SDR family oxidoreductase [Ktedonobacterales bacterium]|jgi:NADP-dependent 3-hydroxy acid dehydrogenase YdfG
MELRQAVVAITGASRGIGRETALAFAQAGAHIVGGSRDLVALAEVQAAALAAGAPGALMLPLDVCQAAACQQFIDQAVKTFGQIDILVNNAGLGYYGPVTATSDAEWDATIRTNVDGVFYCTRAALQPMLARGSGQITMLSSGLGKQARANQAAYCASKFAIQGFAEALRQEVQPQGIRVTLIAPGFVATEFRATHLNRPNVPPPEQMLTARDVAEAIVWAAQASATALPSEIVLLPGR